MDSTRLAGMLLSLITEALLAALIFKGRRQLNIRVFKNAAFLLVCSIGLLGNIFNLFLDLTRLFPQRLTSEAATLGVACIVAACVALGYVLDRFFGRFQWWG